MPGAKFLIFPIDPAGFTARDIQQILANLYFDGEQDVNSELVGTILIGNVPFPTVELDGQQFSSVYPYVNFVEPMFLYDPGRDVFAYNNNPNSQPQLFHSYLPADISTLTAFFEKLRVYDEDPLEYAKPKLWYDDFIFKKNSFSQEHLSEYVDTLLFAEDRIYRKYTKTFVDLLQWNYVDELIAMVSDTQEEIQQRRNEAPPPWANEDPAVAEAQEQIFAGSTFVVEQFDTDEIRSSAMTGAGMPIPTLPLEKSASSLFRTFDDMFGTLYLADLHRNIVAGGRYELQDIDSTMEKIQVWDNVAVTFLKDINTLLEGVVDAQMQKEKYALKYPLPVSYQYAGDLEYIVSHVGIANSCDFPLQKYENHYYGKNAEDIQEYYELTIARGTYLNIPSAEQLRITSVDERQLDDVGLFSHNTASVGMSLWLFAQQIHASRAFNLDVNHIGEEVELFQDADNSCDDEDVAERARWYWGGGSPLYLDTELLQSDPSNFDFIAPSLYDYPEASNEPFSYSPVHFAHDHIAFVDTHTSSMDRVRDFVAPLFAQNTIIDVLEGWGWGGAGWGWGWGGGWGGGGASSSSSWSPYGPPTAQMFNQMWNPSFDKSLGGPQFDIRWSLAVRQEYPFDEVHAHAHHYYSKVIQTIKPLDFSSPWFLGLFSSSIELWYPVAMCAPKVLLNEHPEKDHFEEVEFFYVFDEVSEFLSSEDVALSVSPYVYSGGNDGDPLGEPTRLTTRVLYDDGITELCLSEVDYQYQIINTVVKHKWPSNEDQDNDFVSDLDVMHALTMDRPVDDTRYVTFHGLWGDLVKFIYPNLYRVPVYEAGQLLSEAEIADNIRWYLQEKVSVYNAYLQTQLDASWSLYAQHPEAYDFLSGADMTATPNRTYELFPDNMFVEILWDENIERLASFLYYLNVWWPERPTGDTFGDFVDHARSSFDINRKIGYVSAQYLLKNDWQRKQDPFIVPNYLTGVGANGEHFAYEMWFINSDGFDDLVVVDLDLDPPPPPVFPEISNEASFDQWDDLWQAEADKVVDRAEEDDRVCGIAGHKTVPLFQRPQALVCWYENLLEKPFDFRLRVWIDMPNIAIWDQLDDWSNQWSNRWNQWSNFGDGGGSQSPTSAAPSHLRWSDMAFAQGGMFGDFVPDHEALDSDLSTMSPDGPSWWPVPSSTTLDDVLAWLAGDTWGDVDDDMSDLLDQESMSASEVIEESLRISYLDAQELFFLSHDFNRGQRDQIGDNEEALTLHRHLLDRVVFRTSPGPFVDAISQQQVEVTFSALEDVGPITLTVAGVWANCFSVAWRSTCDEEQTFVINPARDPVTYRFTPQNDEAGSHVLQFTLCQWSVCAMQHELLIIEPWQIDRFSFATPTDTLVRWGILPFRVLPVDIRDNLIAVTNDPVTVSVSTGSLSYVHSLDRAWSLSFNSTREASFFLYTHDVSADEVDIYADDQWIGRISLIDADLYVRYEEEETLTGQYQLPHKSVGFSHTTPFMHATSPQYRDIRFDDIPKISLRIEDETWDWVATPYLLTPRHNLVIPGSPNEHGDFVPGYSLVSTWYTIDVYLLPTGRAGREEILIQAPGIPDQIFVLDILPSGADDLQITLHAPSTRAGDPVSGTIVIRDSWWNLFPDWTEVELQPEGALQLDDLIIEVESGVAMFTGEVWPEWGTCGVSGRCNSQWWALSDADGDMTESTPDDGDDGDDGSDDDGSDDDASEDEDTEEDDEDTELPWDEDIDFTDGVDGDDEDLVEDQYWEIGDGDYTFGSSSFDVQTLSWPGNWPSDDINVMYLNLFGSTWWNDERIQHMLGNSKTLAITTMFDGVIGNQAQPPESMIAADGSYFDPLWLVDSLRIEGDMAWIQLGNNGSVGRVAFGRFPVFLLWNQEPSVYQADLNTVRYTPYVTDSYADEVAQWLVVYDDVTLVNTRLGVLHPDLVIRPLNNHATTWQVFYDNELVGSLELEKKNFSPLRVEQYDGRYLVVDGDYGGPWGIVVKYNDQREWPTNTPFFDGIHTSVEPQKSVGFRHEFMNMTLFAQGQMVGHATKSFGSPYLLNIWDPFLERVRESRRVTSTAFDDGVGQVVWTDNSRILTTSLIDIDSSWQKDLLIAYQDGSLRLLRNHGGTQPFKDVGTLMVFADWLREIFVGDVTNNGQDDIVVLTTADQLRVYKNNDGVFDVDGTLICLDVPNGERNLAQVSWLYGWDLSGDGRLEFVTYDTLDDLRVHYGPEYLSTDPARCDDDFRARSNNELLKNFSLEIGDPVRDTSLRYWPGLVMPDDAVGDDPDDSPSYSPTVPDFTDMSRSEMRLFWNALNATIVRDTRELTNPNALLGSWEEELNLAMEVPQNLRHSSMYHIDGMAAVRAEDYYPNAGFDVMKTYSNLNGSPFVRQGDMLRVEVELIPLSSNGPVSYWDSVDISALVYKDEQNRIIGFDPWTLPPQVSIDWHVAPYEFRLDNVPLDTVQRFSYVVQYNGHGYMTFDVETLMDDFFRAPAAEWRFSDIFSRNVFASERERRVRAFPADGCYKQYWEFSPAERHVDLEDWYDQQREAYIAFFEEQQDDMDNAVADIDADTMKDLMRTPTSFIAEWLKNHFVDMWNVVKEWWNLPSLDLTVDLASNYLSQFGNEYGSLINKWFDYVAGAINSLLPINDFFIEYEKCQGIKFGRKSCGGLPMPFNMSLLDPGTFNIFGCRLFKFDGLPLFSVPTAGIIPVWPPNPVQAWGLFGWAMSQFRLYVSPTLTQWLGFGLCFGPSGVGLRMPSPIGDVVGNCLVMATMLWPTCTEPREDPKEDEKETNYLLEEEHALLASMPTCDERAHQRSPFASSLLQWPVAVPGTSSSVQSSLVPASLVYLRWGTSFNFQIEQWDRKWLLSCIMEKWADKQVEYIANNLLSLNIFLTLPNLEDLVWHMDTLSFAGTIPQLRWAAVTHGYAREAVHHPGSSRVFQDSTLAYPKYSLPRNILTPLSDLTTNPFRALADAFTHFKLFTIETKEVTVEVPFFFQEDIMRYTLYLREWVDRHEKLASQFADGEHSGYSSTLQQAILQVNRNIQILEEYQRFPTKLYELVHAYDNFVYEIMHLVNNVVIQLTTWMNINAHRFSQYVDVIILIKWIIETRQVLIDFSVDWQTKCAKCRQDNYDFYSCKLKLLCVDLPILPIPPFHFPDIYLDMSHLNLWLTLMLPELRFVPKKIPLIPLPDFPVPRGISGNLNLPVIPVLPRPPVLPEVPVLHTDIDLSLPTLPPAPRIPQLMPAIKSVIKIADFIGNIYCIFKWWLWLVAEQGVKTRVEQMTQRTWEIPFFDRIKVLLPDVPLVWFDIKVDTYVNLQVDLHAVYELVDRFVGRINRWSSEKVQQWTSFLLDGLEEYYDITDGIPTDLDFNVDLSYQPDATYRSIIGDIVDARHEHNLYSWWDPETVRADLLDGLAYIRSRDDLMQYHARVDAIRDQVSNSPEIAIDTAWLEAMQDEIGAYVGEYQEMYRHFADWILTDYDSFLESLDEHRVVVVGHNHAQHQRDFGSSLFVTDQAFVDGMSRAPSLEETYLDMTQPMVAWYMHALHNETPQSIGVSPLLYNQMKTQVTDLHHTLEDMRDLLAQRTIDPGGGSDGWTTNPPGSSGRSAATGRGQIDTMKDVEMTTYIEWFFVPGDDGDYHNIIAWNERWDDWYKWNTYDVADINGDGELDIIAYTERQVFVKYGEQNNRYAGPTQWWGSTYTIGPLDSMNQLIAQVRPTHGWYHLGGSAFKVWDYLSPSYDFARQGHNFENMSLSWTNNPTADAYMLKLSNYVGDLPSNGVDRRMVHGRNEPRYLLVVPTQMSLTWLSVELPDELSYASLESHLADEAIIDVKYYDPQTFRIDALLENMERQWYYVQVAWLRLDRRQRAFSVLQPSRARWHDIYLTRASPWSRQVTVGSQYRWDDQPPVASVKLIREITDEEVGAGRSLFGYVQTAYRLEVEREDAGEVLENWVTYQWDVLKLEAGDSLIIEDMDYLYPRTDEFTFYALDQAGNLWQHTVTLEIAVPDIEIEYIEYSSVGAYIHAQLSHEIDRGNVRFEVNRFGYWDHLRPNPFAVDPFSTEVIGGLYRFDTSLSFSDGDDTLPLILDVETGEISLNDGVSDGDDDSSSDNGDENGDDNGGDDDSSSDNGDSGDSGDDAGGQEDASNADNQDGLTNGVSTGADFSDELWGIWWGDMWSSFGSVGVGAGDGTGGETSWLYIHVDMYTGKPRLQIRDRYQERTLYEIVLVPERLWSIQPVQAAGWYELLPLYYQQMGLFAWWYCLKERRDGSPCLLYISSDGHVFSPAPYAYDIVGRYMFHPEDATVSYTFFTRSGRQMWTVRFIVTPFH